MNTIKPKHCPQCEKSLLTVDFHKDASTSDGYYRICKRCRAKNRLRSELVTIHRDRATFFRAETGRWRERARKAEQALAAAGIFEAPEDAPWDDTRASA